MSQDLAIPAALQLLRQQMIEGAAVDDLLLPLRALQMRGLSKLDMAVQIERMRAVNAVTDDNDRFDELCLAALDIVHGAVRDSLVWDAANEAAALLPRCLDENDLDAAMGFAVAPSDLLPPRAILGEGHRELTAQLAKAVHEVVLGWDMRPQRAEVVRAPKSTFTTRPAAVLTFPDRLILEALTTAVERVLPPELPDAVIWPRDRSVGASTSYTERVLAWKSNYVIKADIANFYESVEHSLLAVFLASRLRVSTIAARAIESVLTATMGLRRGLPQGPLASDVLASAYLLPLDLKLVAMGQTYLRYADDFFFPVASVGEGREVIQRLEAWLGELGLALNPAKTSVMRMSTFSDGLERQGVRSLKERIVTAHLGALAEIEDSQEASDLLTAAGVPDETIWDLMYHHTVTVTDVIDQLVSEEGEDLADAYSVFFANAATMLRDAETQEAVAPIASLAFECLTLLSRVDVQLLDKDLREVQRWFPHLTPEVVEYLTAGVHAEWPASANYVKAQLNEPSGFDWVDAWMCYAASRMPVKQLPLTELRRLARGERTGPLTRIEAVRALAAHGKLSQSAWEAAHKAAGPALAAEMLFAGMASPEHTPWLVTYGRDAIAPGVAGVIEALAPAAPSGREPPAEDA